MIGVHKRSNNQANKRDHNHRAQENIIITRVSGGCRPTEPLNAWKWFAIHLTLGMSFYNPY
jgi:hypothetical protein